MNRFVIVLIFFSLSMNIGLAQSFQKKQGSPVEVKLELAGTNELSTVTVTTDASVTKRKELLINFHHRELDVSQVMIRPPREAGTYVYKLNFPETGNWAMWMRYGVGVDTYDEYLRFPVNTTPQASNLRGLFEGDLSSDVPDYVQPVGFAIFAVLLLISLVLVIWTLRWVARNKARVVVKTS